ncbi:MAG TPA: hypothetical protein VHD33_04235, partial [Legionellaceae bacterium]|nr:hypothetical protein [Legionellaceae bacterium]
HSLTNPATDNKPSNYNFALATLILTIFTITVLSSIVIFYSRRGFSYQKLSEPNDDVELGSKQRINKHRSVNNKFLSELFKDLFKNNSRLSLSSQAHGTNENYRSISKMEYC